MARHYSTRLFSMLLAGSMVLPLVTSWGSAAASPQAGPRGAERFRQGSTAPRQTESARLVQLTDAEVSALGLPAQGTFSVSQQPAPGFANPAFQRTWERTDRPTASGQVKRSWYWGPQPNSGALQEDYAEGQGGKRQVQYFDKSRMEINNPNADPNNPFYVTNGLLTVELISGQMQTGNSTYVGRWPADIPLASDPDDANAPTYMSFRGVSNTTLGDHPAAAATNQPATLTINRDGTVGNDPTKAQYPDVTIAYFDPGTKHNVPRAMWDFLNQTGPVYISATGQTVNARLSDPWFYTTGLPISEAYWARVKIAGQMQDVLIQAFERRVVTYVPNGVPGFKVQMGNIGQHYYDWRYKDAGRPAGTATPLPGSPTAVAGQPTPSRAVPPPTGTVPPAPGDPCAGIPPSQNATVTPNCGRGGTTFGYTGTGFNPGENVGVYVTDANQAVYGATFQAIADANGTVGGISIDTFADDNPGIWAFTGEGVSSHKKAIGYFKLYRPEASPTAVPGPTGSCSGIPASPNVIILPSNCERAGTRFVIVARGFQPGENVGVYFTRPDQSVNGAQFQVPASGEGNAGPIGFTTSTQSQQGLWAVTFEGVSSHTREVGYFRLTAP